jgi:hypothetical protein
MFGFKFHASKSTLSTKQQNSSLLYWNLLNLRISLILCLHICNYKVKGKAQMSLLYVLIKVMHWILYKEYYFTHITFLTPGTLTPDISNLLISLLRKRVCKVQKNRNTTVHFLVVLRIELDLTHPYKTGL